MPIDFALSDEQKALQAAARAFAESQLSDVAAVVKKHDDPMERFTALQPYYAAMVDAGFLNQILPTSVGGGGMSALSFAIAAEELARVDINVPSTLLSTGLGLEPIILHGSEDQKERFLRPFAEDKTGRMLAAFAFTEAAGGANFDTEDPRFGVQTFARRDGNHWVISGQKRYTTNGTGFDGKGADLYTVMCRTDPSLPPSESLAVIAVPKDTPGIEIVEVYEALGQRGVISPRVHFNEVRVPADHMIGEPGDGMALCGRTFSWTAAVIGAACVGVMRAAFDHALAFTKTERRSGPVPVIDYQNAGYMLADMKMKIEAARYLTWKACHHYDETGGVGEELAIMTKVYSSELCVQMVYDAMRLVGVDSYLEDLPLEALMRDALCFPLYDGGNMGVRRRQLHTLMKRDGYDAMAAAENRLQPWLAD